MYRFTIIAVAAAGLVGMPVGAGAEPPRLPEIEMRLLDGGRDGNGQHLAGVEIRLEDGWKTYWRHPGDSGLAPSFDFSGSTNVAEVEVLWPAPSISRDRYGLVFGYDREVVLPLVVTPNDPDMPVTLDLDLDFAVCADICVPLRDADTREINDGKERVVIDFYRDLVPVSLEGFDERGVISVARSDNGENLVLKLSVGFKPGADGRLIVEGPQSWLYAVPELVSETDAGATVFKAPLADIVPPDTDDGLELTVTGVSNGFAFEQTVPAP